MEPNYHIALLMLSTQLFHILLILTGAVLNATFLVVFVGHSEIRTPENVMLINLCIGDLAYLLSILFVPYIKAFEFSKAACYVFTYCRSFGMALSVSSVAAVSIQRYFGLTTVTNTLHIDRKKYWRSLLIVAGVWMLAAVLAAAEVLLISLHFDVHSCGQYWAAGECGYRVVTYGVIPSVVIAGFYIAASRRVSESAHQLPGEECAASSALRERRRKSARLLIALAALFTLTYLPFSAAICILKHWLPEGMNEWLLLLYVVTTYIVSVLNPLCNPIVMIIASTQIRELYKKYCCCCCYGLKRFLHLRRQSLREVQTEF